MSSERGARHAKPGQRRDEDTVRNVFRQSDLLDLEPTPAYTFRFLKDGLFGARGRSSVGRALEWHSRGQGFDSPRLHRVRSPVSHLPKANWFLLLIAYCWGLVL